MLTLRILGSRILALFRGRRLDGDLDDEVRTHLDLLAAQYERQGMSAHEARFAARRAFGAIEPMKEAYRDWRGLPLLDSVAQDIRHAVRALFRQRGFTIVAVLSLALGIGATTSVFSVMNAAMFRPLAVEDPGQLVVLSSQWKGERFLIFNPEFELLHARQQSLTGMFAISERPYLRVEFPLEPPTYVRASAVSGDYFDVLGVVASRGRLLSGADDSADALAPCVAVISDALWSRRLGRRPDAIGARLRVRDKDCEVVGVAPAGFTGHQAGYVTDLWLPLRPLTEARLLASQTNAFFAGVMGRLRVGVTREQAENELTSIYRQIQALEPPLPPQATPPPAPSELRLQIVDGAAGLGGLRREFEQSLTLLLAAVVLVLVIAAANVASLLIARGVSRGPEISTRLTLGAGRWRIARQLATEGTVLASMGGLLGVALAVAATPRLAAVVSSTDMLDAPLDARVLIAACLSTMIVALVVGLLPALRLSGSSLQQRAASRDRSTDSRGSQRALRALLVTQFAFSLLLVTIAGLLLRSVTGLSAIDVGFDSTHVVMMEVADETPPASLGEETIGANMRRATRYRVLEDRLTALPGVGAASLSWLGLFSANNRWVGLIDQRDPGNRRETRVDFVSSRYFDVVGMRIVSGRGFTATDTDQAPRVAVVNETLVRERFGSRNPMGSRFALAYPPGEEDRPFTIVGVVRDSHYNDLREKETGPMAWMPLAQAPYSITSISLRVTPGAEANVSREVGHVLTSTDPYVMLRRTTTLAGEVQATVARERLLLNVSSAFGLFALLLAAIGLHGTLAYTVARRRREFGIRLALGARRSSVVGMFLRQGLSLIGAAAIVGIPLSLFAASLLRAFLFGVAPQDPATFALACGALSISVLLATSLPALRASRIDPVEVLRSE